MNKLVIIGNGFDLAHGLKTRYEDFLLWEINEAFKQKSQHIKSPLFELKSSTYNICDQNYNPFQFDKIEDFLKFKREHNENLKINYAFPFIKYLIASTNENWVDIEREYYEALVEIYSNKRYSLLYTLNSAIDLIKLELEKYLLTISTKQCDADLPFEILDIFENDLISNHVKNGGENIYFLNFNYTNTIVNYTIKFELSKSIINNIHGKLNKKDNPIIFGYGDETDKNYEKIEDLNENEFTRHFKSFSYLTTLNYQDLFKYLGKDKFEVHIMGHSCGLSDRVLFNHIFEHDNFDKVQLYYYQYGEKELENDFFQKTQELSRHFKLDAKHKMRTRVVPFRKSKPLTKFKSQN